MIILNDKLILLNTYIGFSQKSGIVIFGTDNVLIKAHKRKMGGVIIDSNMSENAIDKIIACSKKNGFSLWIIENWSEIKIKPGVKVLGILKSALCDIIAKTLGSPENLRS